ncbi:substrate-binding periplasmic protein [Sinorhizobium meliloti]|uniref:substrate-binding periplasmic protein n=1 Tax=Rhizobium meliloti TaxID=382 RepID=UPI0013151E2A|nr:transporter substrate-binding domain-containing protein [Sinorhizobium meliloti]
MNRRYLLTVCALALSMGLARGGAAAQDAPREVSIGVVTDAPPFSYVEDGKVTGVSNEILQRVAELENLKLDYQPMKFPALIPALQAGQIDMAVSAIFVTEARKKAIDFSSPYYTQGAVLVAPINSDINTVADLKGKTIAAELGSAALDVADRHAEEWGITVRVIHDVATMQLAMNNGDVDAMIYDSGFTAYQLRLEGDNPTIKVIGDVVEPTGIAFGLPKGSDLVAVINAGMAKIEANGEMAKIRQKYKID